MLYSVQNFKKSWCLRLLKLFVKAHQHRGWLIKRTHCITLVLLIALIYTHRISRRQGPPQLKLAFLAPHSVQPIGSVPTQQMSAAEILGNSIFCNTCSQTEEIGVFCAHSRECDSFELILTNHHRSKKQSEWIKLELRTHKTVVELDIGNH